MGLWGQLRAGLLVACGYAPITVMPLAEITRNAGSSRQENWQPWLYPRSVPGRL
jgi:hypothetical protein